MKVKTIHKQLPDGRKGFVVRGQTSQRIDLNDLCRAASQGVTQSNHEIWLAFNLVKDALMMYLRRGCIVDIEGLCIIRPGVRSGMHDKDDFTWHDLTPTVNIRPHGDLVRAVRSGKTKWIGRLRKTEDDETDRSQE